jgi:hypothetical protein
VHVRVAHLLERVGCECRSESASAIKDELRGLVWYHPLDVSLDDAFAEVLSAGSVSCSPFVLLADVDNPSTTILSVTGLGDSALTYARLGIVDERQESLGMFHCGLL